MNMIDIAVVDYGMGNLRSVTQALCQVAPHKKIVITDQPDIIHSAERVVFPGQGAMPDCRAQLKARSLEAVLTECMRNKPFLGICLGLQVLLDHSEEGDTAGLSRFAGEVVRFKPQTLNTDTRLKIPHMGWNAVIQRRPHPLWEGIPDESRFYFVHSYYVAPKDRSLIFGETRYGNLFTSAVAQDNIFAIQCHPEKSAAMGLTLLSNFVRWAP